MLRTIKEHLADITQLIANIRWLLDHPAESEQIAARGYATAIAHDTWADRLDTLLELMECDAAQDSE